MISLSIRFIKFKPRKNFKNLKKYLIKKLNEINPFLDKFNSFELDYK